MISYNYVNAISMDTIYVKRYIENLYLSEDRIVADKLQNIDATESSVIPLAIQIEENFFKKFFTLIIDYMLMQIQEIKIIRTGMVFSKNFMIKDMGQYKKQDKAI